MDSSPNDQIARMDGTIPDPFDQPSSNDFTQFSDNDESQAVSDTTDPITPSVSSETSETPAGYSATPAEKKLSKTQESARNLMMSQEICLTSLYLCRTNQIR